MAQYLKLAPPGQRQHILQIAVDDTIIIRFVGFFNIIKIFVVKFLSRHVDGADDKVEGIAFQKALALRQAVPFHPDFHTGTDDQLSAVALSVLVDGVQVIVQVMDVVIFIL